MTPEESMKAIFYITIGAFIGIALSALLISPACSQPISVPCGASIDTAIQAAPAGSLFQLAGTQASPCVYSRQTFHTKSNITIQGDCSSPIGSNTILDGNGLALLTSGADPHNPYGGDNTNNVTIQCLSIQNYGGSKTQASNATPQLGTGNGWILRNCTLEWSGGWGVATYGGARIESCYIVANYHGGIDVNVEAPGFDGNPTIIQNNEVAWNNLRNDSNADSAGIKIVSATGGILPSQGYQILNNLVHDESWSGIWADQHANGGIIDNNSVWNVTGHGIHAEISSSIEVASNTVWGACYAAIWISSSAYVSAFGNVVYVPLRSNQSCFGLPMTGIGVVAECRSNADWESNIIVAYNTVTFFDPTRSNGEGYEDYTKQGVLCPETPHPIGIAAEYYNNTYFGNPSGYYFVQPNAGEFGAADPLAVVQSAGYEWGSNISE